MPSSHGMGQISCMPCVVESICGPVALTRKTRVCATHPSRIYLICVRAKVRIFRGSGFLPGLR